MPGTLVTGAGSAIIKALKPLLPTMPTEWSFRIPRDQPNFLGVEDYDRYVLAHGILTDDKDVSYKVNLTSVVDICEFVLARNPAARICVIGSESATKGSYDIPYWLSKAGLHAYVRERRVGQNQQLVAVAPSAISDTGMTAKRSPATVKSVIDKHPKQRLCTPAEVAKLIHFLLFVDEGYITNTVVEMNGGKFARRV